MVFKEVIINVPYLFHNDSDNHRRAADSRSISPELSPQQAPCGWSKRFPSGQTEAWLATGDWTGPRATSDTQTPPPRAVSGLPATLVTVHSLGSESR